MPIARSQFELGVSSVATEAMNHVFAYLEAHRDQAFAATELAEDLSMSLDDVNDYLLWLQELGSIESKVLRGQPYFAFLRRRGH